MAKIWYGTNRINEDEPCLGLFEMHERGHRYQIIYVIRADKPAEFRKDMGSAKKWSGVDQLRIPGGFIDKEANRIYIEHTVGELREIAEQLRDKPAFDKRELVGLNHIVT